MNSIKIKAYKLKKLLDMGWTMQEIMGLYGTLKKEAKNVHTD